MPRRDSITAVLSLGLLAAFTAGSIASAGELQRAKRGRSPHDESTIGPPKRGPHLGSHGSTVAVVGGSPIVVERNAGALLRTDDEGTPIDRIDLHAGLGEIVSDGRGGTYVADRAADRIVRIDASDAFAMSGSVEIAEPYGLALLPDGATLLVTSVADHELLAVDTGDLSVRWRVELAAEPRGVAVSRDGSRAVVGFLSSGALAIVDLETEGREVRWHAMDPRDQIRVTREDDEFEDSFTSAEVREAPSRFSVPQSTGRRYARNTFAVTFVGHDRVVGAHEVATPQLVRRPEEAESDGYGGAESIPPIAHRLAVLTEPGSPRARLASEALDVHQPRALAYDVTRDTLYVGGHGDDHVVALAEVSQPAPYVRWTARVGKRGDACGIDGLAVDGDRLWVHCGLARRLVRLEVDEIEPDRDGRFVSAGRRGPELATSLRSEAEERGAELFRRAGDTRLSGGGHLACASCHPEGRTDGLTWRLGTSVLQTPMLAGRIAGTQPYKWDGQDPNLWSSLRHTIERLGGFSAGLSRRDLAALEAYVRGLPAPRPRTARDPEAITRGAELFAGDALGCASCHAGDALTDGDQYPLGSSLPMTDTPSLIGLAHTAPYYHDGSARDLWALVTGKGSAHDMADFSVLTEAQAEDLRAYLQSL